MTATTLAKLKKSELIDRLVEISSEVNQNNTKLIWVGVICFVLGFITR